MEEMLERWLESQGFILDIRGIWVYRVDEYMFMAVHRLGKVEFFDAQNGESVISEGTLSPAAIMMIVSAFKMPTI